MCMCLHNLSRFYTLSRHRVCKEKTWLSLTINGLEHRVFLPIIAMTSWRLYLLFIVTQYFAIWELATIQWLTSSKLSEGKLELISASAVWLLIFKSPLFRTSIIWAWTCEMPQNLQQQFTYEPLIHSYQVATHVWLGYGTRSVLWKLVDNCFSDNCLGDNWIQWTAPS